MFNRQAQKEIFQIAWPAIAEQMLIMMVSMVSTIFVGRIGQDALASVGVINSLVFFFQTIFAGLTTGATVIIARITGEGDHGKAKLALIQSLYMGIAVSALVTIIGYVFRVPILRFLFGASTGSVFEIGLLYFSIALIGLPFMAVDMVIAGAVRGAGDTKTPMFITGLVNVINLILSSVLIFGVDFGGLVHIPAFGIKGAAIAVSIARICGALMRLVVLFAVKRKLYLCFSDDFCIRLSMIFRIIKVGIPAFLEQAVMQGGFLLIQVIIVSMSTLASAAWQVGTNANSLAFMPMMGFAISATTMVGQSLGSRDYDRAQTYAYESVKSSMVAISAIGVLTFIFARPLACLYSTDPEVIELGVFVIKVFAVLEPFMAIMNVSSAVLRAAGDIMYVMMTSIIGLWSFRIMAAYFLNYFFGLGIHGVMIGTGADFIVRCILYFIRIRAKKWLYLKV